MASESDQLWNALLQVGGNAATEADYEHGYRREIRTDLSRYVTFKINEERYGLPIEIIVEISMVLATTFVPRTADFVLGVGNVRGQILPVIDLARRLKLKRKSIPPKPRVLIVRHNGEPHAIVVDEVEHVVSLPPEAMEETPGGIGSARADFVAALGRHEGQLTIILDLNQVLDPSAFVLRSSERAEMESDDE